MYIELVYLYLIEGCAGGIMRNCGPAQAANAIP